MKRLVIAVSMLFLLGSVWAQEGQTNLFVESAQEGDLRASELMGATVFVSEGEIVATEVEAQPEDWQSVGTVDDIVFARDGTMRGVLLDVGGFLGLGARTIMVSMDALSLVGVAGEDAVYVVFNANQEQLEAAPEYRHEVGVEADQPAAQQPAQPTEPAQPADPGAQQPPADQRVGVGEVPEGYQPAEFGALTADDLMRAAVYDRFNEQVSGISDVVLSADGSQVEGVLIDIGGFLGLGARTVMVEEQYLEIHTDPEMNDVRVYLQMTQEELEAQPEYVR
jgi:uncharacterized protein YrrD